MRSIASRTVLPIRANPRVCLQLLGKCLRRNKLDIVLDKIQSRLESRQRSNSSRPICKASPTRRQLPQCRLQLLRVPASITPAPPPPVSGPASPQKARPQRKLTGSATRAGLTNGVLHALSTGGEPIIYRNPPGARRSSLGWQEKRSPEMRRDPSSRRHWSLAAVHRPPNVFSGSLPSSRGQPRQRSPTRLTDSRYSPCGLRPHSRSPQSCRQRDKPLLMTPRCFASVACRNINGSFAS